MVFSTRKPPRGQGFDTTSLLETAIAAAEQVEAAHAARAPRQGRRRSERQAGPKIFARRESEEAGAAGAAADAASDRRPHHERERRPAPHDGRREDCSRARPEGRPTRQRGSATDDGRAYVVLDRDEDRGDHGSCCSRVASSRCSSGPCSSGSRRSRSPIPPTLLGSRATGMMTISTTLSSPSLPRQPSRRRHPSIPSSRYGCLWRASRCRNKKPTERRVAPPPLLVLLP